MDNQTVNHSPWTIKQISHLSPSDLCSTFQVIEITLHKEQEGFGFTVAGGVNTGGCYVKQLISNPAISSGRIRPGDQIKKVTGVFCLVLVISVEMSKYKYIIFNSRKINVNKYINFKSSLKILTCVRKSDTMYI